MDKGSNKNEDIDYHEYFMKNYRTIFMKEDEKCLKKAIKNKPNVQAIAYYAQKTEAKNVKQEKPVESHDIKFHIEKIRKVQANDEEDIEEKKAELIEMLRKLLKKL